MKRDIVLANGRYRFYTGRKHVLRCDKEGKEWRNFLGDNAVTELFSYALEKESEVKELKKY